MIRKISGTRSFAWVASWASRSACACNATASVPVAEAASWTRSEATRSKSRAKVLITAAATMPRGAIPLSSRRSAPVALVPSSPMKTLSGRTATTISTTAR